MSNSNSKIEQETVAVIVGVVARLMLATTGGLALRASSPAYVAPIAFLCKMRALPGSANARYPDPAAAKRAMEAMITMGKIYFAKINAARAGEGLDA